MCIFVKPVKEVRQTRILVAPTRAQRALVIYENFVGIDKGNRKDANSQAKIGELQEKHKKELCNAMILPAPLQDEVHEIELLDLSKGTYYSTFLLSAYVVGKFNFSDCDKCFPVATKLKAPVASRQKSRQATLKIVQLGAYKVR
jgi:hypothetical protein